MHTLLSKLQVEQSEKRDLVRHHSKGRTDSSRQLTYREACELIEALADEAGQQTTDDQEQRQRMIRKMLHYGYLLQYDKPRGEQHLREMSTAAINYANVDAWCRSKHCTIRKPLQSMTLAEIRQALTQFENMYKRTLQTL